MLRKQRMNHALSDALTPELLVIENESYKHRVPEDAETHFKVILISSEFRNLTRVARHRKVNSLLSEEFNNGLHALSLFLYTPEEWIQESQRNHSSPPCQHKKLDAEE
jgi:BolA family transcriptional regulator, general stress-responsive regulator